MYKHDLKEKPTELQGMWMPSKIEPFIVLESLDNKLF